MRAGAPNYLTGSSWGCGRRRIGRTPDSVHRTWIARLSVRRCPDGGTYVARETVSLKHGKVFENACHHHTTETFYNPALTADDWRAPGVSLVKPVADSTGTRIITRELESATVPGKSY